MRQLRASLVISLLWFLAILNLERPDNLFQFGMVDLASMVYVLLAMVVGVILIIPEVSQLSLYIILLPVLASYAVLKYALVQGEINQMVGYVGLEVTILIISTSLIRWVAASLLSFEKTVQSVLLGRIGGRILSLPQSEQAINRELLRARQYKRTATLLHITLVNNPTTYRDLLPQLWQTSQVFQRQYMLARVVEATTDLLNDYDIIGWNQNDLVLYLPDTDHKTVMQIVLQIYELLNRTFGLQAEIGLAVFPTDALIYEDLVTFARKRKFHSTQELKALNLNEQDA